MIRVAIFLAAVGAATAIAEASTLRETLAQASLVCDPSGEDYNFYLPTSEQMLWLNQQQSGTEIDLRSSAVILDNERYLVLSLGKKGGNIPETGFLIFERKGARDVVFSAVDKKKALKVDAERPVINVKRDTLSGEMYPCEVKFGRAAIREFNVLQQRERRAAKCGNDPSPACISKHGFKY